MTPLLIVAAILGVAGVAASWIASLDRKTPEGGATNQFARLLNARRSQYGRTGWFAINLARVVLPAGMVLIVIDFLLHT